MCQTQRGIYLPIYPHPFSFFALWTRYSAEAVQNLKEDLKKKKIILQYCYLSAEFVYQVLDKKLKSAFKMKYCSWKLLTVMNY